jgi:hypothetical protein
MIVRKQPSGEAMLMTQTDHSRLAGFLASHWGNSTFAPLRPYESVARAATFHDFGWLRYETRPDVNPETGEPYTFINLPFDPRQLEAYQWCVDWLAGVDRYSALLVGMHRVGLWKSRYQTITYPAWRYADVTLPDEIHAFIDRSEPIQEQERQAIGGDTIWTNYRLLQVWDLLGLYFTMGDPYDHAVEPVPTAYDGDLGSGVRMEMHPLGDNRVRFDPYPFDIRPLTIHIPYRRVDRATFKDGDEFRKTFFQAVPEMLSYCLE